MSEPSTPRSNAINIGHEQVGKLYALAAVKAAGDESAARRVVEELESLVRDVLAKNSGFDLLLASPRMPVEEKLGLIDRVFGGRVSETTLNFLKVLARHVRLDAIWEVAKQARQAYNDQYGRVTVKVRSAFPLDAKTERMVREAARRILNREPDLVETIDPALIGGVVFRVGDNVFDASVANRLSRIREGLLNAGRTAVIKANERFVEP